MWLRCKARGHGASKLIVLVHIRKGAICETHAEPTPGSFITQTGTLFQASLFGWRFRAREYTVAMTRKRRHHRKIINILMDSNTFSEAGICLVELQRAVCCRNQSFFDVFMMKLHLGPTVSRRIGKTSRDAFHS
mmetsp:Transcript_4464/g.10373  ORF Transcript_4464/g.10373 Transcript_4464/m.10373 type:complete len:134 (-) Transcript_4464:368-769(-)